MESSGATHAVPLRHLVRAPHFASTFLASMVGRVPAGAIGLLFLLRTEDLTGSYATGGLATGVLALSLAVAAPLVGRAADLRGHAPVLLAGATTVAVALLAFAALPAGAPTWAILVCAAAAGAANPPLGAALRATWRHVLPDEGSRHAAYALEASLAEVTYILGPFLIVGVVATQSTSAALAVAAAMVIGGTAIFIASPVVRRAPEVVERPRGGALAGSGIRTLAGSLALVGFSVGSVEVAVAATLESQGAASVTGLALGLWGVGSLIGGLIAIRLRPPVRPARRLTALYAGLGLLHLPLLGATTPALLCVLIVAAGLLIAPVLALGYRLVDDLAPVGTQIEAFMWIATGFATGIAGGAPLAGLIAEGGDALLAFLPAAAACLAAAGVAALWRRTIDRTTT